MRGGIGDVHAESILADLREGSGTKGEEAGGDKVLDIGSLEYESVQRRQGQAGT